MNDEQYDRAEIFNELAERSDQAYWDWHRITEQYHLTGEMPYLWEVDTDNDLLRFLVVCEDDGQKNWFDMAIPLSYLWDVYSREDRDQSEVSVS